VPGAPGTARCQGGDPRVLKPMATSGRNHPTDDSMGAAAIARESHGLDPDLCRGPHGAVDLAVEDVA
jgi:hypothetical protein